MTTRFHRNPTLAEYGRTLAEYGRTLRVAVNGIMLYIAIYCRTLPAHRRSRQNIVEHGRI